MGLMIKPVRQAHAHRSGPVKSHIGSVSASSPKRATTMRTTRGRSVLLTPGRAGLLVIPINITELQLPYTMSASIRAGPVSRSGVGVVRGC